MIQISEMDLFDLIFYARRYCDKRLSYAPTEFNAIYDRLKDLPGFHDQFDKTLARNGQFWPHAVDGFNPELKAEQ